ncbi:hypothetical protein J3R82DRAFT_10696 [Butyriboletus roseoflavus]|nr:hypothetical protein J3R82DRAFT_10696 [Butyriboletus roseoflavus]
MHMTGSDCPSISVMGYCRCAIERSNADTATRLCRSRQSSRHLDARIYTGLITGTICDTMPSWSPSTPSSSIPLGSEEDSQLLSQSLPSPDPFDASSHIHTGPGGANLSLSELSLSEKPHSHDGPRFSLLAPPPAPHRLSADQSTIKEDEECEEGGDIDVDRHDDANNTMMERALTEKAREEKLQSDLFVLKKLNASFAVLNDALKATKGASEQVAKQLSQTDALLDKYANMLAKSETVTRLIFDERWGGADADEELLAREREEALEQARLERERQEAASRAAEERARREAEEAAQREAEQRTKQEAAAALAAKAPAKGRISTAPVNSGVRGVRGTRATATAMASRGARGLSKTEIISVHVYIPSSCEVGECNWQRYRRWRWNPTEFFCK